MNTKTPKSNVEKAWAFAEKAHAGQKRDDGQDYFTAHITQVYHIVNLVTSDSNILCAALLHDTVEDCGVTPETIEKEFGKEVRDLVMEITHEGEEDNYGRYFPRLKTQGGIMVKFADRLSNLSQMQSWSKKRQDHYLKKCKFWKDTRTKETIGLIKQLLLLLSNDDCKCDVYHPHCQNCQTKLLIGHLQNELDYQEWADSEESKNV